MEAAEIQRKQAVRLVVLRRVYEEAQTLETPYAYWFDAGMLENRLPFSRIQVHQALEYLRDKGFLALTDFQEYGDNVGYTYTITASGIDEVERAYLAPDQGTRMFPPQVINLTIIGTVGAVQSGANSIANIEQTEKDAL